jgi:hypothetical protein
MLKAALPEAPGVVAAAVVRVAGHPLVPAARAVPRLAVDRWILSPRSELRPGSEGEYRKRAGAAEGMFPVRIGTRLVPSGRAFGGNERIRPPFHGTIASREE